MDIFSIRPAYQVIEKLNDSGIGKVVESIKNCQLTTRMFPYPGFRATGQDWSYRAKIKGGN